MKATFTTLCVVTFLATSASGADQRIEQTMTAPLKYESFELDDGRFYMQDSQSFVQDVEGPIQLETARCLGSGFYLEDGSNSIGGICIFGEEGDTFTMKWKAGKKGAANDWSIVGGTGKYLGMTGEDIATIGVEVVYKAMPMRQTHVVGSVNIPAK